MARARAVVSAINELDAEAVEEVQQRRGEDAIKVLDKLL